MNKEIKKIITGTKASAGDGIQLTRIITSPELDSLDPLLLLDAFISAEAQDSVGGFSFYPHRGFATISYMLAGKAGKPLNEPAAKRGPLVMNTHEEVQPSFFDYESGKLA